MLGGVTMKESIYNIYILNEKEKKGLVYNTLYKTLVCIDDEVRNLISSNRIEDIDNDVLDVLKDGGIVVDDDLDEVDMLKIRFNRGKYNAASIGFTIIPTFACNLACTYCYEGHGDILRDTMNDETIRRTIEFIKKNSMGRRALNINFYGGEPLLIPDIVFRILEELKHFADNHNIQFSTSFTSNGTLFTEEILEKLKEYSFDVQITLSGPREVHNAMRMDKKGNGTYERIMDVIKLLKTNKIPLYILVNVDQGNYNTMEALLEDLKERGYGGLTLSFFPIRDVCYGEIEREIKEIDAVPLTLLSRKACDMGFESNPLFVYNYADRCFSRSDSHLVLDPLGNIFKCSSAVYHKEHRIGTIDESGNLANMNYEAYCAWTLRDPMLFKKCTACKLVPLCAGGCAMIAYGRHGSVTFSACDKEMVEKTIRTFLMSEFPDLFRGMQP